LAVSRAYRAAMKPSMPDAFVRLGPRIGHRAFSSVLAGGR
jgi:hypothetical protein